MTILILGLIWCVSSSTPSEEFEFPAYFERLKEASPVWVAFCDVADYFDYTLGHPDVVEVSRIDRRKVPFSDVEYLYTLLERGQEVLQFTSHHEHLRELFRITEVYIQYRIIRDAVCSDDAEIKGIQAKIDSTMWWIGWFGWWSDSTLAELVEWNHQIHRLLQCNAGLTLEYYESALG